MIEGRHGMNYKRAPVIAGVTLSILLMVGCHRPLDNRPESVSVTVEGDEAFPGWIAGQWQADRHGWQFVFEPGGRISSAVISLGRVPVVPGRTTTRPTRGGGQGVFTPGPWTVHYDPQTKELAVKITMEHVRVQMDDNILEGSSTDLFTGPIADDGIWEAQWTSFTLYTARTPDQTSFDLSTDETYGQTESLVFRKMSDE
jgi:hypothetical protein